MCVSVHGIQLWSTCNHDFFSISEKKRILEENKVKTAQLIDINDSENTNKQSTKAERVVEGAEGSSKRSRHHSKSRQMESMETDILIDLSDDTMDKRPFSKASSPLNGAVVYQNAAKEARHNTGNNDDNDDDDDTQDYSLPEDKQDTTRQHQSMMESMSPTF